MPYLLGASWPVTTVTTPSISLACEVWIRLISACGYGECRIFPISIPGSDRSSAYLPWPVVLPAESTSATRLPMMEKSDIAFLHPDPAERERDPYRCHNLLGIDASLSPIVKESDFIPKRFSRPAKDDGLAHSLVRHIYAPGLNSWPAHSEHQAFFRTLCGQLTRIIAFQVFRTGVIVPVRIIASDQC